MLRYLSMTLFCEGKEDGLFLSQVIQRQVALWAAGDPGFYSDAVFVQDCRTVQNRSLVEAEILEAALSFDVVFIHNDDNERGKIEQLKSRIGSRLSAGTRLVAVVPVRETEAWMLADPDGLPRSSACSELPSRAREVEKCTDPKKKLGAVLGRPLDGATAEMIGDRISLDRLADIPAYQLFLQDLTTALKELNFQ
jgi:Domain of unknown function (DUF4276)